MVLAGRFISDPGSDSDTTELTVPSQGKCRLPGHLFVPRYILTYSAGSCLLGCFLPDLFSGWLLPASPDSSQFAKRPEKIHNRPATSCNCPLRRDPAIALQPGSRPQRKTHSNVSLTMISILIGPSTMKAVRCESFSRQSRPKQPTKA